MNYKMLNNPVLLINEMILFGDTLLNMSVNVKSEIFKLTTVYQ